MVSVRDGLHTRRKFNPKAREDYERKEGNAAQVAQQRAPTVKGEIVASASGMSSQLLHPGPGDGANAPNKLPRQRRPLQEHEDPEQTFMEEFKVRVFLSQRPDARRKHARFSVVFSWTQVVVNNEVLPLFRP